MSLIGPLKSLKEESGSMLSARLLLQLSFTIFGLTEVLELMVRKVKSDIESVKVVMQVRYKPSLPFFISN